MDGAIDESGVEAIFEPELVFLFVRLEVGDFVPI